MEIRQRMSKRFAWLFGLVGLILIAFLIACSSAYNSSSDGLMLVGSQGSSLIETFSFELATGNVNTVANTPTDTSDEVCVLNGNPYNIVIDPAGVYAYAILQETDLCTGSQNGIQAFKIQSDGNITTVGSIVSDPNPKYLAMDPTGKFLFVAEGLNSVPNPSPAPTIPPAPCPGTTAQYGVCVYAIGSGATLTPVAGTFNFVLPTGFQTPNIAAVAVTPTVFPAIGINGVQNAVCSDAGNVPPTQEFLYAVDSANYTVYEYQVTTSSGVLTNPPNQTVVRNFATGTAPTGVAVDPCDRFVYVADTLSNQVSGYTICNGFPTQSPNCPVPISGQTGGDGSLFPVPGSPINFTGSANGPGQLIVDPFGKFVYTLDTLSNQVSVFQISPVSGALTAGTAVVTGLQPTSLAIRGDDNWLFVANFNSATVSQYEVNPSTGALTPLPPIIVDNNPWGVAVK
jgi:6-phosphogluconolactonase (cycloisomerase 2 family)